MTTYSLGASVARGDGETEGVSDGMIGKILAAA